MASQMSVLKETDENHCLTSSHFFSALELHLNPSSGEQKQAAASNTLDPSAIGADIRPKDKSNV